MTNNNPGPLNGVKALVFDTFGTVVDWRASVREALEDLAKAKASSPDLPKHLQARLRELTHEDWAAFAQEWRNAYKRFTGSFRAGETPWKDIDTHHYDSLVELLDKWGLAGLCNDDELLRLSRVWHVLKPWDDSSEGIKTLGTRFVTATLSNGNRSLLKDLNDHGHLGFQKLFSAEDFKAYKPSPKVYLGAARLLSLEPREVALVAAHLDDLDAARSCGLRVVYVERPGEEDWDSEDERRQHARQWVDVWVGLDGHGLVEVAQLLCCQSNI